MAGGSNGYRAAVVRRQLTPGLISSSPGTAGLPPFISFLTSYPDATVGRIDRLNPKFNQARKGECNEQSNPHLRAPHFRKCSARPRRSSVRPHDRPPELLDQVTEAQRGTPA